MSAHPWFSITPQKGDLNMYMKAAVIYEAGGPQQLKIRQVPVPSVKEGWSLIKIKGFGLNHSEIFTQRIVADSFFPTHPGHWMYRNHRGINRSFPFAHRNQVISFMGEMGRAFDGSYAEYTLLPQSTNLPCFQQSALAWSGSHSRILLYSLWRLEKPAYQADSSILVRGGTSGVGLAFLKLIKAKFPHIPYPAHHGLKKKRPCWPLSATTPALSMMTADFLQKGSRLTGYWSL